MKKIGLYTLCLFFLIRGFSSVYASDCSDASPSGDLAITTGCSFSGTVNGVDSGTGSQNTAKLSIDPGGSLTILWGQTLALGTMKMNGGVSVIINGGSIAVGQPLWMKDEDADGFPATTEQYVGPTPPSGGRRRNTQATLKLADGNDTYYCPSGYNPGVICRECSQGGLVYQSEGSDRFDQCTGYNLCNGSGSCSWYAKRIFLTSFTVDGAINGLTGADQRCQTFAELAGLTGTWKAWLSDTTTSASARLVHWGYPYVLVDNNTKIADNWLGLTSGSLLAPINQTQTGATVSGDIQVWTNTKSNGSQITTVDANTCSSWTASAGARTGWYGINTSYTTGAWTESGSMKCNGSGRLYCIEQ